MFSACFLLFVVEFDALADHGAFGDLGTLAQLGLEFRLWNNLGRFYRRFQVWIAVTLRGFGDWCEVSWALAEIFCVRFVFGQNFSIGRWGPWDVDIQFLVIFANFSFIETFFIALGRKILAHGTPHALDVVV